MNNLIVEEVKDLLAMEGLEPKCPQCGSTKLYCSYHRRYEVDLDKETLKNSLDSGKDPDNVWCSCGWSLL